MATTADIFTLALRAHQAGDLVQARQMYQEVVQADRFHADALHLLGMVDYQLGRPDLAIDLIREALGLKPEVADYHNSLAAALGSLGMLDEAEAGYRKAIELKPAYPEAYNNLAGILLEQGKMDETVPCLRQAVRLKPEFAEAHDNLANVYKKQGYMEEAVASLREGLRLKPSPKKRVVLATMLPPIYASVQEMSAWRQRYHDNLQALHQERFQCDLSREQAPITFNLAYQGQNDSDLQRDVARLFRAPQAMPKPRAPGDGKIQIGFISKCFWNHTVGRLFRGLIANLSRDTFSVTVLSVGRHHDEIAQFLHERADRFLIVPFNLAAAREAIAGLGLDVLFYTDIGMDPMTYSLALTRLAPVQCVTWGHPVTTGIHTIDYFISSEDLETADGQSHYTEKLIHLPHLPIYYFRPGFSEPKKGRGDFGLPADRHLYSCLQSLFKLHPEFDAILAGILRTDPHGLLVFIRGQSQHWEELLRQRWAATMPDVADRVQFLSPQKYEDYQHLTAAADVHLDPIHFGGGNTSYEAVALGVPIVTMPSAFLRGRITYALYKQMGLLDCVAATPDHYVQLAVKLGTDAAYREKIRTRILAANSVLFEDLRGVRELEQFLREAVK
jgi:predicted O-linked N-acetylglucosamine transferase (SPINDLY family)